MATQHHPHYKASELDRVINYCEQLAAQARKAKDKGGPATLQALALHRIACALEEMQDDLNETVRIVPPPDLEDADNNHDDDNDQDDEVEP